MLTTNRYGAAALAVAGLYQLTPVKELCLRNCRSPIGLFLTYSALRGRTRDLQVGLRHGSYCVGCCWVLMLLLFVVGVMNLAWIAGLAIFVLVEKLAPAGHWLGRGAGVGLMIWGTTILVTVIPS